MLSIVIESKTNPSYQDFGSKFTPESMCIAGKELAVYWLEWARANGHDAVHIYSAHTHLGENMRKQLSDLYGVTIVYRQPMHLDKNQLHFKGLGIFLNDGSYKTLDSLRGLLDLEQELVARPLDYSTPIGYGNRSKVRIGRNVYIHPSVVLSGNVVIGDGCTIGRDVKIENSVINNGSIVKEGSVIKNSHIAGHVKMLTDLYLDNKALFQSYLYDTVQNLNISTEDICQAC